MTASGLHRGYRFGAFTLNIDRGALFEHGTEVRLRRQSFDVLCYLVEHGGRLVEKQELLREIWGDAAVTDDSLTHCLIDIRKALGDTQRELVRTVPRRGFIFDMPVEPLTRNGQLPARQWSLLRVAQFAALALLGLGAAFVSLTQQAMPVVATEAIDPAATLPNSVTDSFFGDVSEARDIYMQARFLFNRRSPGDVVAARKLYLQAIELEPEFAEAWAGLAGTYVIENAKFEGAEEGLLQQLKTSAENAVAIDPELAEGWVRLAYYYRLTGDVEASDRLLDRAEEADPQDTLLLAVAAGQLAADGDLDGAIEYQQRALDRDSLSVINRINLSFYLYAAGRYEEAMLENQRAHLMRPATDTDADILQGHALIQLGRYREALDVIDDWPEGPDRDAATAMARLALGHKWRARLPLRRLKENTGAWAYLRLAELQSFCDEIEMSFATLDLMRDELIRTHTRTTYELELYNDLRWSPFLTPVRADPRWQPWIDEVRELTVASLGEASRPRQKIARSK